jgi:peptidoglycan hydrolase CwlO-like protein
MEYNLQHMAERLTHIEGQVGKIGKEVNEIGGNVLKISELLTGNEYNGEGLLHTINQQRKEIELLKEQVRKVDEKHESRFRAFRWILVGLSLGSGFGIAKILEMITNQIN